MADMNKQALEMWGALKPMIDKEIAEKTRGVVQRRKAKVTTAPSLITNKIGVTEPFGDQYFVPFTTNLISAQIGDVVWVEFMYGATNAFAAMFASADDKDLTVAGDMTVKGDVTIEGDLNLLDGGLVSSVNSVLPDSSGNVELSPSDIGAIAEAGSDGFLVRESNTVSEKQLFKSLWTGRWSSGSITVDGLSNYSIFLVRIAEKADHTEYGSCIFASIGGASRNYLRGIGGYASGTTTWTYYQLGSGRSGDTLTFSYCFGHTSSGTNTNAEVIEIIGII